MDALVPSNCIEDIISRWAPPSENDTKAYIRSVCALTGIGGKERLTETQWPALVKAMAVVESRMHLDEGILKTAYNLYLNLKKTYKLNNSETQKLTMP